MRGIYRMSIFFSIILLLLIGLWFRSEHLNSGALPDNDRLLQQKAFNEQQSEDLAMTIQMFLDQVENDLERMADFSDEEKADWLSAEIINHQHIDGFASYDFETKEKEYEEGTLPGDEELWNRLDLSAEKWGYSAPYVTEGAKKMLMSLRKGEGIYVSEVDLTFIEHFIKDLAALADHNGNFFIGNSEMNAAFSTEEAEADETLAVTKIPELNWELYINAEETALSRDEYKKGEVVVILEDDVEGEDWAERHNVNLIDQTGQTAVVRNLTKNPYELIEEWAGDPEVVFMEPNYTFEKQSIGERTVNDEVEFLPNDEFYADYQWNLHQLNLEEAWVKTKGGEEVLAAIIDSGIDPDHPDLKDRIIKGYNAFENNKAFSDDNGHGTHVAGIVGAETNNDFGVAGVTWEIPLLAVKVLDDEAMGNSFSIAKGIRWATDNGAKVINLSLGDDHDSKLMHDAVKYAYDRDVVIIAATGNDNVRIPMYPAAYEEVLAVGSLNMRNRRSFYSNFGNHIDVTAPGEHIPSTFTGDEYVMMSGTSMAAPHVAGIASLIRSHNPDLSNEEVYEKIRKTSTDLGPRGFDPFYGHGMVNAADALLD
ncbi:Serine protease, subtilisin family [Salipaludibacillus aurantiacus]|uniref:Serine protease, subtilisin family n=2 Tax=Salipaludibacillus aurantiacus TaxID=1601833 RepID=A0A1H9P1J9_9BACI|nr:Serine protease, subtilisin family [Salipaludibacillus aurantiacus]